MLFIHQTKQKNLAHQNPLSKEKTLPAFAYFCAPFNISNYICIRKNHWSLLYMNSFYIHTYGKYMYMKLVFLTHF